MTTNGPLRSSNPSVYSFGGGNIGANDGQTSNAQHDFLPSVNFDDLHSSITTASNDLNLNQFPTPNGRGSAVTDTVEGKIGRNRLSSSTSSQHLASSTSQRPTRSNSIVRRQSTSTRQSSISSTASMASLASGSMDPPHAPLTVRTRRQSQYPPISGNNAAKTPRRSIGPGGMETDFAARASQRRRPSLASSTASAEVPGTGSIGRSSLLGSTNTAAEGARLATARAAKAKSMQPPARQPQIHLSTPIMTPEHNRSASFATRSPGQGGRGTTTPSSATRRMSVMPGMPPAASHATGLGARTVSPTDARRAKRMSTYRNAIPVPDCPPAIQPALPAGRATSRSPSMLPRKVPTPSSSRTTPDLNRKSYSSGLSVNSSASYNTARTSTGSLQARLPQGVANSRLPTAKSRNVHSAAGNDDEEVPPVPAIPKAYESPKDSPIEQPFFKRKPSLPPDTSGRDSSSTNEFSMPGAFEPAKPDSDSSARKQPTFGLDPEKDPRAGATPTKRKDLQPLQLPPLNLLPLGTPTAAKIAALGEPTFPDGNLTPPPRRVDTKTPTTPLTASKSSFFSSRSRHLEQKSQAAQDREELRSSSSVHHLRNGSTSMRETGVVPPTMPIAMSSRPPRQAVSPYVSSSLPKSGGDFALMPRSTTSGEFTASDKVNEQRAPKLTGPRAQTISKAAKTDTPTQHSSPDEPGTPSSGSSLRRKLSLSWKRTTSKNSISLSHAATERESEYPPPPPKHDNMPPPRLPASATMNNLSSVAVPSPSPSVKSTNFLDSKRRKSSVSSLSMFAGHERTRSDSWGFNRSPKKERDGSLEEDSQKPRLKDSQLGSSVLSPVHRMLNPKASTITMKPYDRWTADLDKDDLSAEDEIKKLASKRKETEQAARHLDALRKRATAKEAVSSQEAIKMVNLNIYERGEIVDYKEIYFCGTANAQKHVGDLHAEAANFGYDDERGDYSIVVGDHLCYRYEIVNLLGKGSFGQVVRCIDHKTGVLVAVKIIRNKKRFHQQALVEVNILQKLREWDPKNKHSMVNFTQSFYFRNHLCISTELLDMNLYEFIKANSFRGFSLKLIRRFTKQLLDSLLLLKQHRVIHCDLKPENVLLAHPMHTEIKVIDFGSSCFENEKVYTYIQSRFYRSPEVILGMTYGMPIDMWSVGCILAELFTGYPIFPGENEQEQLACIMEVFGPPEKHLIERSTRKKLFFDSMGKPRLTVSSKGRRRKPSSKTLQQVLKCDDEAFLDFLTKCLRWDPDKRLKPDEAVKHEFLTGQKAAAPRPTTSRTDSPIKRYNTVSVPSAAVRPLPEPPGGSSAIRARQVSGSSPIKPSPVPASARRQSTMNNNTVPITSKRASVIATTATPTYSSLPRVTTRSVSGSQALAAAGAASAMTRKG